MAEHSADCTCIACFQYEKETYHGLPQDKQITQLKADLARFGGHTAECFLQIAKFSSEAQEDDLDMSKCDCGFEKAKKRWG